MIKKITPLIKNDLNEALDTWVEWEESEPTKASVVMVHGFGTDKHETAGYFDDVASALVLNHFRVVRFDFSGYGASEGLQRDACYSKHIEDLNAVISYTSKTFSDPIYIFAQSMGCFVTALTSPTNIVKTVMTGIPNADPKIIIDRVISRFGSRPGAILNMEGISYLPRSTGKTQEIGPQFWVDISRIKPIETVRNYARQTELLVVSWNNDEIIGKETMDLYDTVKELKHLWLNGNHSVNNPIDRQHFIKVMLDYYDK